MLQASEHEADMLFTGRLKATWSCVLLPVLVAYVPIRGLQWSGLRLSAQQLSNKP